MLLDSGQIKYEEVKAMRFFNTIGPCNPVDHYMLPPEDRLIGAQLHRYIRDKLYWVLHAPRQTGKTTFLQSWMAEINSGDEAIACYVSIETTQGLLDRERGIPAICAAIRQFASTYKMPIPNTNTDDPAMMLQNILANWSELIKPRPLVVLFDEVDVLQDDTLISFLRQLRSGFANRGIGEFPVSIALVGMRDLKDYITAAKGGVAPNLTSLCEVRSPFNIKEDSAIIGNFSRDNVASLFAQRTKETGQKIADDALDYVWEQSRGQPWIVNSLFSRATMRVLQEDDYQTVTIEHIKQARKQLILARETHLDSLSRRMNDPRVRYVMNTLMTGEPDTDLTKSDGFMLCEDLGLVTKEKGTPQVANPIYREVLAREMTYSTQDAIPQPEFRWQKPDGSLDMDALLKEFQKFWRRHSEIWEQKSGYTEVFPHLLLQAFLQRVLNGGGRLEREYAAGRGRMDIAVEYKEKIYIIEIKLIHNYDTPDMVREEGSEQIERYRDKIDKNAPCYLLIFDRRDASKKAPWDERLSWNIEDGITVVGC
ncbi:MAG: PD-(D/E)XK nuclease domain-containing protein [Spirochaetaceae bacterium]|jgi:hypothetical protein|nr:PD-(D/E)XK nuclease domain-containing protein [Spirochaetaceae bacterium]